VKARKAAVNLKIHTAMAYGHPSLLHGHHHHSLHSPHAMRDEHPRPFRAASEKDNRVKELEKLNACLDDLAQNVVALTEHAQLSSLQWVSA
jgi:hypothetical protein